MRTLYAAAAVGIAALAATVALSAPAAAKEQCFRSRDIGNHTVAADSTLYLKVGLKDVYRVTTRGRCATRHDTVNPLVIRTAGGSGMVCRPLDLDLAVARDGFVSPCLISGIAKLTPAEAAALPKKLRP